MPTGQPKVTIQIDDESFLISNSEASAPFRCGFIVESDLRGSSADLLAAVGTTFEYNRGYLQVPDLNDWWGRLLQRNTNPAFSVNTFPAPGVAFLDGKTPSNKGGTDTGSLRIDNIAKRPGIPVLREDPGNPNLLHPEFEIPAGDDGTDAATDLLVAEGTLGPDGTGRWVNGPTGAWGNGWWTVHNFLQYGGEAVLGYVGFGITSGPFRDQSLIDIDAVMCVRGASAAQNSYVASVGALRRYDHIGLYEYTDRNGLSTKNIGPDEYSVTVYGKKAFLAFGTNEEENGTIHTPLIADVAGCMARTDRDQAPWFSPAGARRGRIVNSLRLVDNPTSSDADTMYDKSINVVVTFPGEGTILFGDKTNGAANSSLSRINVVRLFVYLKKVLGRAARGILFELNDNITRAGFVTAANSILNNIQAQRGLSEYRIVCDETNNPPAVIDANEFVADVYLKPSKSINFIKLRFTNKNTADVL